MEAVAQAFSEYELERGKPMPSTNHAVVQGSLIGEFLRQGNEFSVLSELSLELDGTPFIPDISVYRRLQLDPLCDQIKKTEPPLLAVEILSPTQPLDELIKKASAYLKVGVQTCWLVQPSLQNITVFLPGQKPRTHTEGEVRDSATGITVKLEDVFSPFS